MLLVIIFSTYDNFLWLGHRFTIDLKVQKKYLRQEVCPFWCFIIFLALAEMEICQTRLLSQVSFFFQMSLNHEFVSTGFLNFKLIFWQITKMIICRYSEEVWSVLVGSIVWYRVSRDNQLYAELCSPRGCSIVSNYYHKLRKLVGGDSFRELELGKWVTITITFLNFFFHLPETCLDKPTPLFRG